MFFWRQQHIQQQQPLQRQRRHYKPRSSSRGSLMAAAWLVLLLQCCHYWRVGGRSGTTTTTATGGGGARVGTVMMVGATATPSQVCQGGPAPPTVTLSEEAGSCSDWTGTALDCCQICHQMYSANHISRYILPDTEGKKPAQCCCYYQGFLKDSGRVVSTDIFYHIQGDPAAAKDTKAEL
ncbi:hypothetical protein ACA910_006450 [Epithemia clementina (nom. ined.)]